LTSRPFSTPLEFCKTFLRGIGRLGIKREFGFWFFSKEMAERTRAKSQEKKAIKMWPLEQSKQALKREIKKEGLLRGLGRVVETNWPGRPSSLVTV
jgi:hypothetical protein